MTGTEELRCKVEFNCSIFYKLIGREVRQCESHADIVEAFKDRWTWKTDVGGKSVSTVFLALNHNFTGKGPPVLFETMVFPEKEICIRYCTYEEAVKGHSKMVELIRKQKGHVHAGTDNR